MTFERDGNDVTGVVTRCEYCEPIDVKGTYQGDIITVEGFSQAGSHIKYELTVTSNDVKGAEILSAEGEVERQNVTMTIVEQRRYQSLSSALTEYSVWEWSTSISTC